MKPERLQEISDRLGKATKGPWVAIPLKDQPDRCGGIRQLEKKDCFYSSDEIVTTDYGYYNPCWNDAQLIANAPQDIADLLAHTEALQRELSTNAKALRYVHELMQDAEKFHKAKEYIERVINEQENTRKAVGE